jgi:RNA polymerase sigma factor (sigma-70 family)
MRDGDMVAAIVTGDQGALAAAYDHYASALYSYCRSLLSDPGDAADAVRDTFVVAAAKLSGLRDPSRLRPWLYAVAGNECRRQKRRPHAAAPFDDDATAISQRISDFSAAMEQAELRDVVKSALAGLNPGDQEVVELSLRHEFYGADLADALGVPRNQAHALAHRVQTRFEAALGGLLLARSGQGSCPELGEILADHDGELTGPVRKEVRRHITTCPVCEEHRRRQVNPVAMLEALPTAVLPAGLRYQVLGLLAGDSPESVAYCAEVAQRAEPFLRTGFPAPVDPAVKVRGPATFVPAAGVVVAVFAVFGGGAMLAANSMRHSPPPVSSVVAPAVPSAQAAPAVNTPAAFPGRSQHKTTPGNGRGNLPGYGPAYFPGATTSGKQTRPASHSPAPTSTRPRRSSPPPTSSPPTSATPTSSSPTSSASASPTNTATPGTSSGLLGAMAGLLYVL